jgi:hypothetical protein
MKKTTYCTCTAGNECSWCAARRPPASGAAPEPDPLHSPIDWGAEDAPDSWAKGSVPRRRDDDDRPASQCGLDDDGFDSDGTWVGIEDALLGVEPDEYPE